MPAPLFGWMHEKPWKEARWCNCLDAGRRRAPGVADLPGGAGRRHVRDRGATARCRSTGGLPAALAGLTAGGLAARPDPAQRGPDGECRDPGRRGDLPQCLPGGVQPGDPRRHSTQVASSFGEAARTACMRSASSIGLQKTREESMTSGIPSPSPPPHGARFGEPTGARLPNDSQNRTLRRREPRPGQGLGPPDLLFHWGERGDSNPRHPGPQQCCRATEDKETLCFKGFRLADGHHYSR